MWASVLVEDEKRVVALAAEVTVVHRAFLLAIGGAVETDPKCVLACFTHWVVPLSVG